MPNSYWSRTNTKEWCSDLELKVEDFLYYKKVTMKWCDEHDVEGLTMTTKCLIASCIWVANMRGELITLGEIYDILGIPVDVFANKNNAANLDELYKFTEAQKSWDLEKVLAQVVADG